MDAPSRGYSDIEPALGALPLFPLPTVLLPGALLPLHVFEPRYRAMVRDVLGSHRTLSVVLALGAEGPGGSPAPPIADVAGVGVIVDHVELPNGRFEIVLRGRARVRLEELPFRAPYRRARAAVVGSVGEARPSEVAALVSAASGFAAFVRKHDPRFDLQLPSGAAPGLLVDVLAQQLVIDPRDRQILLETLDVGERVRRAIEVLSLQRATLVEPSGAPN